MCSCWYLVGDFWIPPYTNSYQMKAAHEESQSNSIKNTGKYLFNIQRSYKYLSEQHFW